MVQVAEARPPYVTFEVRAEEDRAASIEAGHYVGKDVHYALVTPMGSKDRLERNAEEWFVKLEQDVIEGRFPREWFTHFKTAYKAFCEGNEAPLSGTAIVNWPPVSPAQIKTLQSLHVRTVEDLAQANEEVLGRLGMGGRALKQKAIDWLASSKDIGKVSEEMSALRASNDALKVRNEQLESQVKEILQRLDDGAKAKKL